MTFLAGPPLLFGTGAFYLHVQMLTYYLVAFGLGVALGYLIWGWGQASAVARARQEGQRTAEDAADARESGTETGRLKAELDICVKARATLEDRLEKALADLKDAKGTRAPPPNDGPAQPETPTASRQAANAPTPETETTGPPRLASRPERPDDLKKIKGIGPKLEKLLNELGVYHFHQIAGWRDSDADWVNARLKFSGRIERDGWIAQAKRLSEDT
ncbi:MAG: hypothetical protein AAGD47_08890 [Pseudomonadota bacterium]